MKKIALFILAPLLLASSVYPFSAPKASAVTAADWKAGRIIDDGKFASVDMSVADIQNFLNSKVPNCDTWGTQPANEYGRSDINHAQYAASRGWPAPPYVCLKNYHEVPKTTPGPGVPANSYGNGGNPPAGSISAAQMIYNAATQYNISPKVLLVKLDTESAGPLTRDSWPLPTQYKFAMGAHCPDSGPGGSANCDANYAGFSIQIAESAALLRYYLNNMSQPWWQYKKPFQTNNILWNVAPSGCGASNVYLETKGTAALYTYTPYQPNQAALNNMYGTGDGCSAYGNRNFWRVYFDWFGRPTGRDYDYDFVASSSWINNVELGQTANVVIRVRNTGNKTWFSDLYTPRTNPVRLMIQGYQSTEFADLSDPSWLSKGQVRMVEQSVAPGDLATFSFRVKAPLSILSSSLPFTLVADGIGPMEYKGMNFLFRTIAPSYSYTPAGLRFEPKPNDSFTASVSITNTGTSTWYADGSVPAGLRPTRLIGKNYSSVDFADLSDPSWLTTAQIKMQTASVGPGQTGTFTFKMRSPAAKKVGHIYTLTPVLDGVSGLTTNSNTPMLYIDVPQPVISGDTSLLPTQFNLTKNQPTQVTLSIKNTGNTVWHNESLNSKYSPTRLITYSPYYRSSSLFVNDGSWLTSAQISMQEQTINPGEIGTFKFTVNSNQLGDRVESFALIIDGGQAIGSSNIVNIKIHTTP